MYITSPCLCCSNMFQQSFDRNQWRKLSASMSKSLRRIATAAIEAEGWLHADRWRIHDGDDTPWIYRENPGKKHGKSMILWAKHGQNHGKFWENPWFMEVYSWGFMEIIRGLYGDYAWTMIDSWMLSKPLLGFVWKSSTPTLHCLISNFPHI